MRSTGLDRHVGEAAGHAELSDLFERALEHEGAPALSRAAELSSQLLACPTVREVFLDDETLARVLELW